MHNKWAAVFAAHVERWNEVVDRGMSALQDGNLDEAERNLREALADAENDPDVLNGLAMIAYRRRDYARAKESARRAIDGTDAIVHVHRRFPSPMRSPQSHDASQEFSFSSPSSTRIMSGSLVQLTNGPV